MSGRGTCCARVLAHVATRHPSVSRPRRLLARRMRTERALAYAHRPGTPLPRRLWTRALVDALATVRHRGSVYFGMMQWQGGCELSEVKHATGEEVQGCAGCWGGWFGSGAASPRHCMPMWRANWAGSVKQGSDECPAFRMAPFACGPFEARSRHLALTVARCDYARRYFGAMSRRGDAKRDWCVSADGGQGHALGQCMRSMHVADLGPHRQKYATVPQMNESRTVIIVHPIKSRGAENDARRLPGLIDTWERVWSFLRRAEPEPRALVESRVHFRSNDTRPLLERAAAVASHQRTASVALLPARSPTLSARKAVAGRRRLAEEGGRDVHGDGGGAGRLTRTGGHRAPLQQRGDVLMRIIL